MDKTIEYILEVAKCGGITKAANNLYITPSALSKFVQSKEEELQVRLFNRIGKKFVLTYAGERYVELLKGMMEMKQQMDIEMSRISSMYMGRLRIGFQMSLADTVITQIIPEFQKNYPNIQIMLEEGSSTDIVRMLKNNQLDIVITTLDQTYEEFNCELLTEGEIVLAVPNNSPLCDKAIDKEGFKYPWIDFRLCKGMKTILLSKGQVFRHYSDQIFEKYNIKPDLKVLVRTTKTALLCVGNYMGITITFDQLVYQNHYAKSVKLLSFGENRLVSHFAILSSKSSILYEETNELIKICKHHLMLT